MTIITLFIACWILLSIPATLILYAACVVARRVDR